MVKNLFLLVASPVQWWTQKAAALRLLVLVRVEWRLQLFKELAKLVQLELLFGICDATIHLLIGLLKPTFDCDFCSFVLFHMQHVSLSNQYTATCLDCTYNIFEQKCHSHLFCKCKFVDCALYVHPCQQIANWTVCACPTSCIWWNHMDWPLFHYQCRFNRWDLVTEMIVVINSMPVRLIPILGWPV